MVNRSMTKLASIDVGTNSVLLLIAEIDPQGKITPLHDEARITRLGEGFGKDKILKPEAMERTFEVLKRYVDLARSYKVSEIRAVGTSALRDAENREVFLNRVKSELGLSIEVISGEREAWLTYRACVLAFPKLTGKTLMLDIGGGSTEFIFGDREHLEQMVSLNIGSVRATEMFLHSDPIGEEEFQSLHHYLQDKIRPVLNPYKKNLSHLIGVAGTVTTLAAMDLEMIPYNPSIIHGFRLTRGRLDQLLDKMKKMTLVERKKLPGLDPGRADVIVAGGLILKVVLEETELEEVIVSDWGIRHGLLESKI